MRVLVCSRYRKISSDDPGWPLRSTAGALRRKFQLWESSERFPRRLDFSQSRRLDMLLSLGSLTPARPKEFARQDHFRFVTSLPGTWSVESCPPTRVPIHNQPSHPTQGTLTDATTLTRTHSHSSSQSRQQEHTRCVPWPFSLSLEFMCKVRARFPQSGALTGRNGPF